MLAFYKCKAYFLKSHFCIAIRANGGGRRARKRKVEDEEKKNFDQ